MQRLAFPAPGFLALPTSPGDPGASGQEELTRLAETRHTAEEEEMKRVIHKGQRIRGCMDRLLQETREKERLLKDGNAELEDDEEIKALEKELESIREQKNNAEKEKKKVEKLLKELEKAKEDLEEIEKRKSKEDERKAKLDDAQQEKMKMEEEIKQLSNELEELEKNGKTQTRKRKEIKKRLTYLEYIEKWCGSLFRLNVDVISGNKEKENNVENENESIISEDGTNDDRKNGDVCILTVGLDETLLQMELEDLDKENVTISFKYIHHILLDDEEMNGFDQGELSVERKNLMGFVVFLYKKMVEYHLL